MFVLAVEEFREALGLIEVERAGGIVQFRPSALGAELAVGDQVAEPCVGVDPPFAVQLHDFAPPGSGHRLIRIRYSADKCRRRARRAPKSRRTTQLRSSTVNSPA